MANKELSMKIQVSTEYYGYIERTILSIYVNKNREILLQDKNSLQIKLSESGNLEDLYNLLEDHPEAKPFEEADFDWVSEAQREWLIKYWL